MARRSALLNTLIAAGLSVLILVALAVSLHLGTSSGPRESGFEVAIPAGDDGVADGAAEEGRAGGSAPEDAARARQPQSAPAPAHPAGAIRGVILDSGGRPVAGARVELVSSSAGGHVPLGGGGTESEPERGGAVPPRRSTRIRTDSGGRFEVGGLFPGDHDLEVTADGFAARRIERVPTRDAVLEIRLEPGLFVGGDVVGPAGEPLEGAEVRLIRIAADPGDVEAILRNGGRAPLGMDPLQRARTDERGQFAIAGLASGTYRAEVDAPGYLRAIAPILVLDEASTGENDHLLFQLEEGHEIWGIVRAGGGEPVAGALVRARFIRGPASGEGAAAGGAGATGDTEHNVVDSPRAARTLLDEIDNRRRRHRRVRTGETGLFELASLPEGVYRLEISAESRGRRIVEGVATGGEPVEVELGPGQTLTGAVIDGETGNPVSGAQVSELESTGGPDTGDGPGDEDLDRTVTTDANGRFELHGLPQTSRALVVEAEGYRTVEIVAGDDTELVVELERAGSVSGHVHAPPALPVEGLRVLLVRVGEESTVTPGAVRQERVGGTGVTDAGGAYRLFVPGSGSYQVEVEGTPCLDARSRVLVLSDPHAQVEGVDIQLEVSALVQGVVTTRDGRPIAAARVRIIAVDGPGGQDPQAAEAPDEVAVLTNAFGEFEARAGGGTFRVRVRSDGFVGLRSEDFWLVPGATKTMAIELEPERTIRGMVLSQAGEPIPAALIQAVVPGESDSDPWSRERTLSSTLGRFRLGKLANRPYDLHVSAAELASALVKGVAAGRTDVRIQLEDLVSLEGRVVGTFSGAPVAEYSLRLAFADGERLSVAESESVGETREFSEPDGVFSIAGLPPGRYLIEVESRDCLEPGSVEVDVPLDPALGELVITLPERGLIGGTVLGGRGEPVAGARVQALRGGVDALGARVTYRPLPPGEGDRGASGEAVSPGTRAQPGGGGRELRGDGETGGPAEPAEGAIGRTDTRSDGTFFLRGLPDGRYRLSVTHDDFVPRELGDYALEDGTGGEAATGVRVFLDPGARIHGRVRGLSRAGVSALAISLDPSRRSRTDSSGRRLLPRKSARVDADGAFEFRGLAVGRYTLRARYRRPDGSFAGVRRTVVIHEAVRERGITLDLDR